MYVRSAATPSKVAGVVVSNSSTTPASTACAAVSATSTRAHPARHLIEASTEESERSQPDIASSSRHDTATASLTWNFGSSTAHLLIAVESRQSRIRQRFVVDANAH